MPLNSGCQGLFFLASVLWFPLLSHRYSSRKSRYEAWGTPKWYADIHTREISLFIWLNSIAHRICSICNRTIYNFLLNLLSITKILKTLSQKKTNGSSIFFLLDNCAKKQNIIKQKQCLSQIIPIRNIST